MQVHGQNKIFSPGLYPAHFLPTPEGFIKNLENVMYSFIWNSTDKIKRKTLIAEIEYGGLKMVDI